MLLCAPRLPVELLRMRSTQEGLRTSPVSHKLCSWGTKGQPNPISAPPGCCPCKEVNPHPMASPRPVSSSPRPSSIPGRDETPAPAQHGAELCWGALTWLGGIWGSLCFGQLAPHTLGGWQPSWLCPKGFSRGFLVSLGQCLSQFLFAAVPEKHRAPSSHAVGIFWYPGPSSFLCCMATGRESSWADPLLHFGL